MKLLFQFLLFVFITVTMQAQTKNDDFLEKLLRSKGSPFLHSVLNNPDSFQYQIIYTEINRNEQQKPAFTNYYLNVDRTRYFNPASTVKMPVAFAALEKINSLEGKIKAQSTMLTDSSYSGQTSVTKDETSANGLPSIDHYIKKIFIVSDNDAYNRLYEFNGQQYLNELLWKKGYKDIRITRRFTPMNQEQNRHTNQIRFFDNKELIYTQPPATSSITFEFPKNKILVGIGHLDKNDSLINRPMDFTTHNNLPLEDGHYLLRSVLFPEAVLPHQRFNLSPKDYELLYNYMSELPYESKFPKYDTTEFFDSYTKFFFFRAGKEKIPDFIRVFNKAGWSYGFLTDYCYVVDFKNNIEFMLSGTIYVNKDGILNDDKYEYEETGYPFLQEVGKIIYEHELQRQRAVVPDLDSWKRHYN